MVAARSPTICDKNVDGMVVNMDLPRTTNNNGSFEQQSLVSVRTKKQWPCLYLLLTNTIMIITNSNMFDSNNCNKHILCAMVMLTICGNNKHQLLLLWVASLSSFTYNHSVSCGWTPTRVIEGALCHMRNRRMTSSCTRHGMFSPGTHLNSQNLCGGFNLSPPKRQSKCVSTRLWYWLNWILSSESKKFGYNQSWPVFADGIQILT